MRIATILLGLLLSAASCTHRVYWPQGHYHRAAVPAAPSSTAVLYQRWSPAPVRCQQPVPFYLFKK